MTSDQDHSGEREQGAWRTDADFMGMTREELLSKAAEMEAEVGALLDRRAVAMAEARAEGPIDEDGAEVLFLDDLVRITSWFGGELPDPGRVALAAQEWEGREHDFRQTVPPIILLATRAHLLSRYLTMVASACGYLPRDSSPEETP